MIFESLGFTISSVLGRPFTVGSHYPANKKAECYKQESDKWETLPDFPFAKVNIENYGIASTHSKGSTQRFLNVLVTLSVSMIPVKSRVLIFGGIYDRHRYQFLTDNRPEIS